MTYASGDTQAPRAPQVTQAKRKTSLASARAAATPGTIARKGVPELPMTPDSRAILREHLAGPSDLNIATSSTSSGVGLGIPMIASGVSDQVAVQSAGESNSQVPNMVNIPRNRARPFTGYRLADFNPVAATGLALIALSGLGVIWLALTLIDAWSKV